MVPISAPREGVDSPWLSISQVLQARRREIGRLSTAWISGPTEVVNLFNHGFGAQAFAVCMGPTGPKSNRQAPAASSVSVNCNRTVGNDSKLQAWYGK